MRILLALPLMMMAGACDVRSDEANDQMTVDFNQDRVEEAAEDVGNAAEDAAEGAANLASEAGEAIENGVGDVDVDLDANRNENREANRNSQ